MSTAQYHHLFNIVLVGDSGVGKSSLVHRFSEDTFSPNYMSTIGVDFARKIKTIQVQDCVIKLQIWDTGGQERFRAITSSYYRGAHGIVVVYDVTSQDSFTSIRKWKHDAIRHAPSSVELLLLGNKSDLKNRTVPSSFGEQASNELQAPFYECSAKAGQGVEAAFYELTARILHKVQAERADMPQDNSKTVHVGAGQSIGSRCDC